LARTRASSEMQPTDTAISTAEICE
jgi:hypothetical protein